jgi:hypothetical protein
MNFGPWHPRTTIIGSRSPVVDGRAAGAARQNYRDIGLGTPAFTPAVDELENGLESDGVH